jgi:hypothetical protein
VLTKAVGIEMPDDFPTELLDRLQETMVARVRPRSENAWGEAGRGWNNVAYRFRSMADDSDAFIASVNQHGAAPEPEERYQQERQLYGVFVGGQSSLESFGYCVWASCSVIAPTHFLIATEADLRNISLRNLRKQLRAAFGADEFHGELKAVLKTPSGSHGTGFGISSRIALQ